MTVTENKLRLKIAYKSDTGLVRSENQDFAIVSSPTQAATEKGRLMVVADGMGGHRGGATASRLAATTIEDEYLHASADDVAGTLRRAFESANSKVFQQSQENPDLRGMGTTGSAVVVRDGQAFIAHVGDSRVYLIRNGEVRQLTDDHSLVASMVREGLLTTKEAEVHPRRNVLQRSIGVGESVDVDVLPPIPLENGDTFVLCSDGLHGLVKEPELREISQLPVEAAVQEFVKRALDRGAPDNVTVVVARVEPGDGADEVKTPETTRTEPMRAVTERGVVAATTAPPAKGSFWRWLFGLLVLAAVVSAALYLLGYRLDYEAARSWFS